MKKDIKDLRIWKAADCTVFGLCDFKDCSSGYYCDFGRKSEARRVYYFVALGSL